MVVAEVKSTLEKGGRRVSRPGEKNESSNGFGVSHMGFLILPKRCRTGKRRKRLMGWLSFMGLTHSKTKHFSSHNTTLKFMAKTKTPLEHNCHTLEGPKLVYNFYKISN